MTKFNCQNCHTCCKELPIPIGYHDIKRWEKQGRNDILKEIMPMKNYPKLGVDGFYFLKTIRAPKKPCPFLNGGCKIHSTRPMACRDFPLSVQETVCPLSPKNPPNYKTREKQSYNFERACKQWRSLANIILKAKNGN